MVLNLNYNGSQVLAIAEMELPTLSYDGELCCVFFLKIVMLND